MIKLIKKSKLFGISCIIIYSIILLLSISLPIYSIYEAHINDVNSLLKNSFYIILLISIISVFITRIELTSFIVFARVYILCNLFWWTIIYISTYIGEYINNLIY